MQREQKIQLALKDFNSGVYKTLRQAAAAHRVSKSTLTDRYNGKPTRRQARVRQQLLSPQQEELLCKWILDLEKAGSAPSHSSIKEMASMISSVSDGPSHVGTDWVPRFLKRHPDLKTKTGKTIDHKRVRNITKQAIEEWYTNLQRVMELKNIKTCNIWNMDEIGTALGVVNNQRVVGTADTNSTLIQTPNEREWCTAIECITADGRNCKPLLIFKAKNVQQQWFIPEEVPDWVFTSTESAFTTDQIGLRWLLEIFEPETRHNLEPGDWRLLVLDGHKSHITEHFQKRAYLHNIWCYYLVAHASHILQPLDLAVFSSLKRRFRSLVAREWETDGDSLLKKQKFITQYGRARDMAITPNNCKSGFQAAGIHPYDPSKALNSRFVLDLPPSRPTTPPQVTAAAQNTEWNPSMTPQGYRHIVQAIQYLSKDTELERDVRTILAKTGRKLDLTQYELAAAKQEIISLNRKLKRYRSKRKKRKATNPNKDFIRRNDILVDWYGPPTPSKAASEGILASEPSSSSQIASSVSTDPLSTAILQLQQSLVALRNI
jgi:hypothetical protein